MKKSVFFTLTFLVAASSFAGTTRGYLVQGSRGVTYYAGITDDQSDSAQLDIGSFTKAQVAKMNKCMDKRDTHAILVTTKLVAIDGPTGVPFHDVKITDLDCVKAPGYIHTWRAFWKR